MKAEACSCLISKANSGTRRVRVRRQKSRRGGGGRGAAVAGAACVAQCHTENTALFLSGAAFVASHQN